MDGVLVEVTHSYREATRETVRHFTGALISEDEIQDFKNAGGWNNGWLLSQRLIGGDDAHSAEAAGVPFVGVSMSQNPRHAEIAEILRSCGVLAVLVDINELEALVNATANLKTVEIGRTCW